MIREAYETMDRDGLYVCNDFLLAEAFRSRSR